MGSTPSYAGGPKFNYHPRIVMIFCGVPKALQVDGRILQIKPWPLPSTSFSIHYSLIDATDSVVRKPWIKTNCS